MHERERRDGGLQRMAPVMAREAVVAREAGASPVTAREAVVAREAGASRVAPVAPWAAPAALMRPCGFGGVGGGSGGIDGARPWWLRGCQRRQVTASKWGGGEVGTRRRSEASDLGEKWWPGGGKPLVKSNIAVECY